MAIFHYGLEASANAVTPPDSFLLWQMAPPSAGSASSVSNAHVGKNRPVCNIIVLMETISNVYSHAQPQPGSTPSIRRSGRTRQFHRGGKRTEPNAARGDPSGPGTGAALPGGPRGALRQAGLSDPSGREIDRTCSKSPGRRLAHASGDASVRRWVARPGTHRHQYDRADVLAATGPATA